MGRPSVAPGVYFRMLWIGYCEGLSSERGIAWRVADPLSLRQFLGCSLTDETPDHSSISRTRHLYALETHRAVFRWVVKVLGKEGSSRPRYADSWIMQRVTLVGSSDPRSTERSPAWPQAVKYGAMEGDESGWGASHLP
ncbi:MAG: transposase [Acidobacteria bacterium]|nr:transposase [Acidobacteriota bacterium]